MRKIAMMVTLVVLTAGLSAQAERYVRGDHITTTGAQWINTHYQPTATDTLEIKMKFNSVSGNPFIWCSRTGGNNSYSLVSTGNGNQFRVDHGPTTSQQLGVNNKTVKPTTGTLYTIICDGAAGNISFNGTVVNGLYTGDYTPDGYLSLFACPDSDPSSTLTDDTVMKNFVTGEFYYFRVYDADGELVREYLPVLDCEAVAGSEIGVYETVTGEFFKLNGSAGATFAAGNLIASRDIYRSVTIESISSFEDEDLYGEVDVQLRFNNPGLPHRLFLCSGATDAGADDGVSPSTNGWDSVVELEPVGAFETERVERISATADYFRFYLQPLLPDGATSVRYVNSSNSGDHYVDTGIPLASNSTMVLNFYYFGSHNGITNPGIFGARKDGNAQFWCFAANNSSWTGRFGNGTNHNAAQGKPGITGVHTFVIGGSTWDLDGNSLSVGAANFDTERNAYLFALNENGGPINYSYMGVYSCAMHNGDSLKRMFLPCRKADGTGALFDMVSGGFFSSGSTALAASYEEWHASGVISSSEPTWAIWVGGGEPGDVTDAANWCCGNDFNQIIDDVVPGTLTYIGLSGYELEFDIPADSPLVYGSIDFFDVILTHDTDLSGLDHSKVVPDASIEMDGFNLKLTNLDFDGRITNGGDATRPVSEGGVVTSPTTFFAGSAENLFHNNYSFWANTTHRALVKNENLPMVAVYDFGEEERPIITSYRIFSSPGIARSPKQWKLSGSDDNENWTDLDVHSDETDWYPMEARHCYVDSPNGYRYYRFEATDPMSAGDYLQLTQLELYTEEKPLATLELTVPADQTVVNTLVSLSGNLKLVKKGAGTFSPAKMYQDYVGGTQIVEGSIKADPTSGGSRTPLGGDAELVVEAGATFDFNHTSIWSANRFVLNGGSIINTGAGVSASSECICSLRLTADSTFAAANAIGGFGGGNYLATVDLGGHTLEIAQGTNPQFNYCIVSNGTINCLGNATFYTSVSGYVGAECRQFKDVVFTVPGELSLYNDATIDTLILPADFAGFSQGGKVWVAKRANLATDNFPFVKLLDGATLDFSGRTTALSTTSSTGGHYLSFADNANIVVEPGTFTLEGEVVQLLDWSDDGAPTNLAGLSFELPNEWKERWSLRVRDNGLYLIRKLGAVLFIR